MSWLELCKEHSPVKGICVSVCAEGEEAHQAQISENEEPAEERRPGEQEMQDEEDGEDETRLPCMEPFRKKGVSRGFSSSYQKRGARGFGRERERGTANLPDVIALFLQNQQYNSAEWRESDIGKDSLVIQSNPQTRIQFTHHTVSIAVSSTSTTTTTTNTTTKTTA